MRAALRVLAFPLVCFGGTALAAFAIGEGADPQVVLVVASVLGAGAVALLERVIPWRTRFNQSHGDVLVDLVHSGVTVGLVPLAFEWLAGPTLALATRALGGAQWPSGWPLVVQVALALVIGELGAYWLHRVEHQTRLFRLHAVHHSPERLYFLNVTRIHPVDALLSLAVFLTPLLVLGIPKEVLAVALVATSLAGSFQHGNVDQRLGPLTWIFSGAELHRWHHQRPAALSNHNYGQTLIVWDVVFGTRYAPDAVPSDELGLESDARYPRGYLGQLAAPLRAPSERSPRE